MYNNPDFIKAYSNLLAKFTGIQKAEALCSRLLLLRFGGMAFDSDIILSSAIEYFINYALISNIFIFLTSVLPFRYFLGEIKGEESDGLKLINAIKSKRT